MLSNGVHFSCKITNAILNVLEEQSEDLSPLYEQTHLSVELLRDPSYWISAPDMEQLLENLLRLPLVVSAGSKHRVKLQNFIVFGVNQCG